MILRVAKVSVIGLAGLGVLAGLVFGTELGSYVWTSTKTVRTAVKDAVPIEFELQRAKDLVEDIIPEMQANIRLIAQEEVEIAQLKQDIAASHKSLGEEQTRIAKLTGMLKAQQVNYTVAGIDYSREQVKGELARAFDRYKEAEVVLSGKQRLADTRSKSLAAAMQMLDRTRSEKSRLEDQIASLESQHRLVKAAAAGSNVQLDNSKLARTETLIRDIKGRLDVAERVLAHQARFVQPIQVDVVDEADLLKQVESHFQPQLPAGAEASSPSLPGAASPVEPAAEPGNSVALGHTENVSH